MNPRPDPELLREPITRSENYEYWNRVVFPASEDARREKIFRPRAERIAAIAQRHGAGCAQRSGRRGRLRHVLRGGQCARASSSASIALEPEPHLAATCRGKGLDVIEAPIEDAELDRRRRRRRHELRGDRAPLRAAGVHRALRALVPTAGLFVVTCPNVKGLDIAGARPARERRRRRAPELHAPGLAGRAARVRQASRSSSARPRVVSMPSSCARRRSRRVRRRQDAFLQRVLDR